MTLTDAVRTLLLVRHGRTAWNAEQRAQGHADVPLDEVGRQQAVALTQALSARRIARVWSSDLARAAQTAAVVADAFDVEIEYDARLREFDVGERQGLTATEFSARFPSVPLGWGGYFGDHGVPGAETVEEVRSRVMAAIRSCAQALDPGELGVVVMHGAALRVGLFGLLGWPWELVDDVAPMRNCHWAEVRFDASDRVQLAAYNAAR